MDFSQLIERLELSAHPEGGYYRETFRSAASVISRAGEPRSAMTSILFLLPGTTFSALHRLASDETWHFYRGDPITIESIRANGTRETTVLGPDGPWQTAIAAGSTFGSYVERADGYALVGCDVAPGFEFAEFRDADPNGTDGGVSAARSSDREARALVEASDRRAAVDDDRLSRDERAGR